MIDFKITQLHKASVVLRSLKNSLRAKIFTVVKEHPGITVGELYAELHIEQSVASKHLHILRQSGIVRTQRDGRMVHYSLDEVNIKIIALLIEQLAAFYVPGMSSLKSDSDE